MKIDWKTYFEEFSVLHGGNPVLFKKDPEVRKSGYLLFSDGWMYCSWNVKGPEYPPPTTKKEHLFLMKSYWAIRGSVLEKDYELKKYELESLVKAQLTRNVPLQVVMDTVDSDENGSLLKKRHIGSVDFQSALEDLKGIVQEINFCHESFNNVEDTYKEILEDSIEDKEESIEFNPAAILSNIGKLEHERQKLRNLSSLPNRPEEHQSRNVS